mmetsp:Transcript_38744/g.62537  ORF Transcript_38744/g.62537 Transcript_38744/m.62537 type:complete len:138 (+) Transcript_38744:284-697(+)
MLHALLASSTPSTSNVDGIVADRLLLLLVVLVTMVTMVVTMVLAVLMVSAVLFLRVLFVTMVTVVTVVLLAIIMVTMVPLVLVVVPVEGLRAVPVALVVAMRASLVAGMHLLKQRALLLGHVDGTLWVPCELVVHPL